MRPPLIWGAEAPLLPDIVREVEAGRFRWIDHGHYAFAACHVVNVCYGAVLAGERGRPGQVYFVTDGRDYRFREFWTAVLNRLQVRPPTASVPFGVAWQIARVMDSTWRTLGLRSAPPLSRQMLRMIADYPRAPLLAAFAEAQHYGLFDLDRVETMVLRRIATDFFRFQGEHDP